MMTIVVAVLGCAGVHDPAELDSSASDADADADARVVVDSALPGDGASPDAEATGCFDGLVRDGAFCVGWRAASPFQRCLHGRPSLVVTDIRAPWADHDSLAVACEDELLQVYRFAEDRWERRGDAIVSPVAAGELPATAPDGSERYPPMLAAATLPDGTRVAVAGSLHAHPPFETWIAAASETRWRRSIDAPWLNPFGAGVASSEAILFVGDDSYVFIRVPRLEL